LSETAKPVARAEARSTRRRFLRGAGVAGVTGVSIAAAPLVASAQAQSPAVSLRLQGAWSAKDIFHEYALDFAKKINDMSAGRLRVEILPAGTVVKMAELLDAVHKGTVDGCHGVPALWQTRDVAFSLFGSGPALGMDGNGFLAWMRHGGGMEHYTDLIYRTLNLNVVPFFYGPMPTQPLGWFRKPVKSGAEFKGMKIRVTGLAAEMFREMGAVIESVADADVAAAMKSGKLDAVELNNVSSDRWLGLPGIANVCMLQSYHQPAEVFEVLFNRRKFDALPADLQAIVRHAAEASSADMSWKALHRYSEEQAQLVKLGVTFLRTPVEVLRAQMTAWGAVTARMSRQSPVFERVWQSQREWARRTVAWSRDTVVDSALAYDFWFGAQRR
jgi:TRAP-type mannitol/chloroaromatic compound transport system substrate-binding protein